MKGRGLAWLAVLPLAVLLLLLVAPLLRLVLEGWGSAGQAAPSIWAMWQDDYLRWRVGWSVLQAAATCVADCLGKGMTLLTVAPGFSLLRL